VSSNPTPTCLAASNLLAGTKDVIAVQVHRLSVGVDVVLMRTSMTP
jgi:hypothetical protein